MREISSEVRERERGENGGRQLGSKERDLI